MSMNTRRIPAPPAFPHGVTVEHVGTEHDGDHAPIYADYAASRANGTRHVATVTMYPDGRAYAVRSTECRGSLDYAAWSGIVRTLGGSSDDYYAGILLAAEEVAS